MLIKNTSLHFHSALHVRILYVPNNVRNLRQSYLACVFPERTE